MRQFTQSTTLMGDVTEIKEQDSAFRIKCGSGDELLIHVARETRFQSRQNLDGIDRDLLPNSEDFSQNPSELVKKYIHSDRFALSRRCLICFECFENVQRGYKQ